MVVIWVLTFVLDVGFGGFAPFVFGPAGVGVAFGFGFAIGIVAVATTERLRKT